MNVRKALCVLTLSAGLLSPMTAFAKAKDYQVTGPIVSIEKNVITVMKNDEKWEIDMDDATKIEGKLEVGQKVTIHYHMVADKVDKKDADEK